MLIVKDFCRRRRIAKSGASARGPRSMSRRADSREIFGRPAVGGRRHAGGHVPRSATTARKMILKGKTLRVSAGRTVMSSPGHQMGLRQDGRAMPRLVDESHFRHLPAMEERQADRYRQHRRYPEGAASPTEQVLIQDLEKSSARAQLEATRPAAVTSRLGTAILRSPVVLRPHAPLRTFGSSSDSPRSAMPPTAARAHMAWQGPL